LPTWFVVFGGSAVNDRGRASLLVFHIFPQVLKPPVLPIIQHHTAIYTIAIFDT